MSTGIPPLVLKGAAFEFGENPSTVIMNPGDRVLFQNPPGATCIGVLAQDSVLRIRPPHARKSSGGASIDLPDILIKPDNIAMPDEIHFLSAANYTTVDGETWTQQTAPGYGARTGHRALVHGGWLYVVGGVLGGAYKCDVWRSKDGRAWERITPAADWNPRKDFGFVSIGSVLVITGGQAADGSYLSDIWYSGDGEQWFDGGDAGYPARARFGIVTFNDLIHIIGGQDAFGTLPDVWKGTLDGQDFQQVSQTAGPLAGDLHSMGVCVFDGSLYVLGGVNGAGNAVQAVFHSADAATWTTNTAPTWPASGYTTALKYNAKLWKLGGTVIGGAGDLADAWYSTDGNTWTDASADYPVVHAPLFASKATDTSPLDSGADVVAFIADPGLYNTGDGNVEIEAESGQSVLVFCLPIN